MANKKKLTPLQLAHKFRDTINFVVNTEAERNQAYLLANIFEKPIHAAKVKGGGFKISFI